MRRVLSITILFILMFCSIGCAKIIDTEYEEVEVKIVDEYHRGMWLQPVYTGKVHTFITHPAVHRITVEYNGVEYTVDGEETYYEYRDNIGQTVTGILEISTYDDDSIRYDVIELIGYK